MSWFRRHTLASSLVTEHFPKLRPHEIVSATRDFPITARPDVQLTLDDLFKNRLKPAKFVGVHSQYEHHTLTFGPLPGEQLAFSYIIAEDVLRN